MRKTAICIGTGFVALLQCGAAQAQSDVTMYGVLDVFAEFGKAGTQAASESHNRVQSGGANGSRLGFRGFEDLGGGLKANFVLEHGLLVDSGLQASGTFWNRQAFVGLSGDWGGLTIGRQYSPLLTHQDTFDTALSTTGYGSAYNSGVMSTIFRVNNGVLYKSPVLSGFSGTVMFAPGEGGTSGRTHSASAMFSTKMFGVGAAYLTTQGLGPTREDKTIWNIAGSVTFGGASVMAAIQNTKNDSQDVGVVDDRAEFFFGGTYAFGANELRAAYGQGKVKNVDSTTARHYSLGYLYNLSKRTALYAAVQEIDNPDNLAYRGTNGFTFDAIEGGLAAGPGVKARAFAVGMRHRF